MGFVAVLFMATFSLMFIYARQAVRTEAEGKAEDMLQQLEVAVRNTVTEKMLVARQTHWIVQQSLNNPAKIDEYLQQILRNEPQIIGTAVAFEPGFYPSKTGDYMIYYYRKGTELIKSEQFAGESYIHQPWFEETLTRNKEYWSDPKENYRTNGEPIISFGIPLRKNGKAVGVFAIDISLVWLSETITKLRPSENMYGAVLTRKGAFLVHPDTTMLRAGAVFDMLDRYPDKIHNQVIYKMMAGETGTAQMELNGSRCYAAYKPMEGTNSVIDVVCPENEIMGNYNQLIVLMMVIVVLAMLMLTAVCYFIIHRELLPLRTLEASAKQMTKGDYFSHVTNSGRLDEVGSLTNSFLTMRRSIRQHIDKIKNTREMLDMQNKALSEASEQMKEADKVKTAFLQNMTDNIEEPVNNIMGIVKELRTQGGELTEEQIKDLAAKMDAHTCTVTTLLDRTLEVATKTEEDGA